MRIAIVDDEAGFMEGVEAVLADFGRVSGEKIVVRKFSAGSELLDEIASDYDLYILDVQMPELDGLEVAREIRKAKRGANIVFLSNYGEYALPAYKVRAYDYIMKGSCRKELPAVLKRVQQKIQRKEQEGFYLLKTASWAQKIYFNEVLYLEKEKKYTIFHCTEERCYKERIALGEIYPKLPQDRFLYINKGCIINLEYVSGFKDEMVKLEQVKDRIVVSHGRVPMVWENLGRYWGERGW